MRLADVAGKNLHAVVGDSLRLDHDTNLAACLNSVGFLDPVVGAADLLELFETLYVVLVVLASCCGAGCADRVGCLYERCDYRAALNVAVVSLDSVNDLGVFFVLAAYVNADLYVRTFDLVVKSLTDIMEQTCASCKGCVNAKLACHDSGEVGYLDGVAEYVLAVGSSVLQSAYQADQARG